LIKTISRPANPDRPALGQSGFIDPGNHRTERRSRRRRREVKERTQKRKYGR